MDAAAIRNLSGVRISAGTNIIDGKLLAAADGGVMDVVSPIDGQRITSIPRSTKSDVDSAVAAARRAFDDGRWSGLAPSHRKAILLEWAASIEKNALDLAVLGVRDNGTEISMALKAEPLGAAATIR